MMKRLPESPPLPAASVLSMSCVLLAALAILAVEPALANKFEKIGGGFAGPTGFKREWLVKFFAAAGGVSLLGAVLAVVVPHRNALYLNFNNWRQSAIVLGLLALVMFAAAALI